MYPGIGAFGFEPSGRNPVSKNFTASASFANIGKPAIFGRGTQAGSAALAGLAGTPPRLTAWQPVQRARATMYCPCAASVGPAGPVWPTDWPRSTKDTML